jgi:hypothetical protein
MAEHLSHGFGQFNMLLFQRGDHMDIINIIKIKTLDAKA